VEQVRESSSVSQLDGDDVVYVARVPTRRIMTVTISVGTRFPAYATSMGRVLLADKPADWLDTYLASTKLLPLTPHTIADPAALRAELDRIRAQGWALVDQELEEGCARWQHPSGTVTAGRSPRSTSRRTPGGAASPRSPTTCSNRCCRPRGR